MNQKKTFHLTEITPVEASCSPLPSCPGIFKSNRGTYVIVGKTLTPNDSVVLPEGRVASDEAVVEVPEILIDFLNRSSE